MTLLQLLVRFPQRRKNGYQDWHVPCPAHDDDRQHPEKFSLHVTGDVDRILLHCFAGCPVEAILGALRLAASDLFFSSNGRARAEASAAPLRDPRATLAAFAQLKQLPETLLKEDGWREDSQGLVIPYRQRDGSLWRERRRTSLKAGQGFLWDGRKDRPLIPYGRQRLDTWMEKGELWLVEGESDAVTAWHHGLPCLGLPGNLAAKALTLEDLAGIDTLWVVMEPGQSGIGFAGAVREQLRVLTWTGTARLVQLPAKDLSELHMANPPGFRAALAAAQARAEDLFAWQTPPAGQAVTAAPAKEHAAAPSIAGKPTPVLVRLDTIAPEPVEWLWPGRIARGKLTLIVGDPGTGKSTVTADVAARSSKNRAWPDGSPGADASVLWLTAEDGLADTVRPRIDRQDGDARRIHILRAIRVDGVDEAAFTLEHSLPAMERALVDTQAALVIVDPLSAYLGSRDSYKDAEIRGLLAPLAALAEQLHVAVLAVLHLTKDAQRRLLHRAQGSIGFVAAARTVLAVGEDPDVPERRLVVSIKNNLGPLAPALAFRIDDRGLCWESDPVAGAADRLLAADLPGTRTERRERTDARAFLQHLLAYGPIASRQVEADAKANGIAQRTLWRAKAELGIVAGRSRTLDGKDAWYWTLPAPEAL
jgi:putative DNA primase/helicase